MLLVLADDFSGAAEMAGIAHRFGLSVEIQLDLDLKVSSDVIVFNTDTRILKEYKAVKLIETVAVEIMNFAGPVHVFKKIDSVMRGHLIPEINALQYHFDYDRVLILPTNPSKNRIIVSGRYLVDGEKLSLTDFANDPDFPMKVSFVEDIVNSDNMLLDHAHMALEEKIPVTGLITSDVSSYQDLEKIMAQTDDTDMICGAADCFEIFLKNLGHKVKQALVSTDDSIYHLVVNGSTFKNNDEKALIQRLEILQVSLPSPWKGNQMTFEKGFVWRQRVLDELVQRKSGVVSIDQPILKAKDKSDVYLASFNELVDFLIKNIDIKGIHFGLTGGATAAAIIKNIGSSKLRVKEEIAPGVVTVVDAENPSAVFTVKPGSYPWPSVFLDRFDSQSK